MSVFGGANRRRSSSTRRDMRLELGSEASPYTKRSHESGNIISVFHEYNEVGKKIKRSKCRVVWIIRVDQDEHVIRLEHSQFSGKIKVWIDTTLSKNYQGKLARYPVHVEAKMWLKSMPLSVFSSNYNFTMYDLIIDGVSYHDLPKNRTENAFPVHRESLFRWKSGETNHGDEDDDEEEGDLGFIGENSDEEGKVKSLPSSKRRESARPKSENISQEKKDKPKKARPKSITHQAQPAHVPQLLDFDQVDEPPRPQVVDFDPFASQNQNQNQATFTPFTSYDASDFFSSPSKSESAQPFQLPAFSQPSFGSPEFVPTPTSPTSAYSQPSGFSHFSPSGQESRRDSAMLQMAEVYSSAPNPFDSIAEEPVQPYTQRGDPFADLGTVGVPAQSYGNQHSHAASQFLQSFQQPGSYPQQTAHPQTLPQTAHPQATPQTAFDPFGDF